MVTIDLFTIVGMVCVVAVIAVMFTLCKFNGGCSSQL